MISNQLHPCFNLTLVLAILFSTGCLVLPVKTGTHIQNPTGKKDKLPKFAIVPGQTTREEIEQQFQSFALDSGVPNLFWARFRKSTWALFWGIGGYGGAAAGGGRMWGAFNLLVRFDENGRVVATDVVQDKDLLAHLQSLCESRNFPALDLSQPARVNGDQAYLPGTPVEFQLLANSVVVKKGMPDRKVHKKWLPQPPVITTIPISEVKSISARYAEEVRTVPLNIKFLKKTTVGKSMSFNAPPADVLTLIRWQQQAKTARNTEVESQKQQL